MDATSDQQPKRRGGNPVPPHGVAWQSSLNPHEEFIWGARKAGRTWREIASDLEARGAKVAPSTVMRFVRARVRRAAKLALPDLPGQAPRQVPRQGPHAAPQTAPVARLQEPAKEQGRAEATPEPKPAAPGLPARQLDDKGKPVGPNVVNPTFGRDRINNF